MKDFIKKTDSLLVAWCTNFKTQIDIAATSMGLDQQFVTLQKSICDNITTAIANTDLAKNDYKVKVDIKQSIIADGIQQLRGAANQIKSNSKYTDGIGQSLGIVGTPDAPIDTQNFKPTITLALGHGYVIVKFTKKGIEGVNVYSRLQGSATWTFLAHDTHSPYDDHRMLATAGAPENREYMVIGALNDSEIGVPSDIASITFAG